MDERASVANSWRIGPDGASWGRTALNLELDSNLSRWGGPGHWNNPGLLISTKNDGSGYRSVSICPVPRCWTSFVPPSYFPYLPLLLLI
jgi:hypothetical protein